MSNETTPKLLKARQRHSRVFGIAAILFLFVSQPMLPAGKFPRECMLWLGYFLVILGAFGRAYSSLFIGGRKNDVVVRHGVFSIVRNPLYVFSFLATVGIGLQSGMVLVAIMLPLAYVLYYPQVVAKEEAFLTHKFGEAYETYTREVPRWKPNFKLWNEPEHVEAMPKFVRKTMLDALVFFLAMPAFVIIHTLQNAAILPIWMTLP